jgi:hypothetical protein
MTLAAILGLCLLLPSWEAANARYLSVTNLSQSTQSQKDQSSDSPSQSSVGAPPTDEQKTPDQSAKSPDQSTATPPCPDNSQSASGTKSPCKSAEPNAARPKKHHPAHKAVTPAVTPAATPATGGPTKTVVRNGSAADPTVDLSPAPGPQEASHLEAYSQLLATTDANLQKISGRQLSPDQQDTVKQIKSYMEQAKGAAKDGDVQRAYNLAVKANLLSAELAGH